MGMKINVFYTKYKEYWYNINMFIDTKKCKLILILTRVKFN